jgi:hypothetical protein
VTASMPRPVPPLTRTARRARAAAMIRVETELPALVCQMLADTVDAMSGAALRAAGCADDAARSILAALWTDQ